MAEQKKNIDFNLIITAGLVIGGLVVVNKIIGGVKGLLPGGSAEAQANQDSYKNNAGWNPNYWKQYQGQAMILTQAAAQQFAQQLHGNFSWDIYIVNSANIDQVMSILSNIKTKTQMSFLVYTYNQLYGEDLFSIMNRYLFGNSILSSDNLMNRVVSYVDKLPDALIN